VTAVVLTVGDNDGDPSVLALRHGLNRAR
jgi:hypothetical protein